MANGRIPKRDLARVYHPSLGLYLAKDAAAAWNTMRMASRRYLKVDLYPGGPDSAYRTLARQRYWRDYWCGQGLCGNAAPVGYSNHGNGEAVDVPTRRMRWAIDRIGAQFGYAKKWSDACVPLNTRILTRHGWKTWDEVVEGDETIGYNPETEQGEWTPILAVNRQRGDLLSHAHSRLRFVATRNHRWLTPGRGHGPAELRTIEEIDAQDPQARLLLAAPAESGSGLDLTTEEAALLGWALTDGSIYRFQNSRGLRAYARVYQTKAVGVAVIGSLMENFEHRKFENWTKDEGSSAWYVGRNTFSPIYHRSRLEELGPVGMVVSMTAEQRKAFLDAARLAEGTQPKMREIAQQKPKVREAIATAAALEGHLVTLRPRTVNLVRPRVQRDRLQTEELGRDETWCPTTALGSWLAEQDGQIFLTGNSNEWWHIKYTHGKWNRPDPGVDIANPIVRKGSGGYGQKWAVKAAQRHLVRHGFLPRKEADGFFGDNTANAVKAFQRSVGIKADGVVGAKTWARLRGKKRSG